MEVLQYCPYCKQSIEKWYYDLDSHLQDSPGCEDLYYRRQSTLLNFVREPKYFAGILPYAKSIGFYLPGHGHAYASCGSIFAKKCDNFVAHPGYKKFVRYAKHSCRRRECPICFEDWSTKESEKSLVRLTSFVLGSKEIKHFLYQLASDSKERRPEYFHVSLVDKCESALKDRSQFGMRPIHVIVSPPVDSKFDKKSYPNLRSKATSLAKTVGLRGGVSTFHPYRLHCRRCNIALPEYHDVCPKCGEKDIWWVPSPHFHVVGFGWIHDTEILYNKTGWVVKNAGVRKSVFWTMQYLLSHAGVFNDPDSGLHQVSFHTVTWLGELSYRKMPNVPKIHVPKQFCPHCGLLLQKMEDCELNGFPPPDNWNEDDFLF